MAPPSPPSSAPVKSGRGDRRVPGIVALVTLVGLALRLWGIGWSLPDARHPLATYHPDELANLFAAQAADIPHLQFDIKFYNYGAFYFYLVSLAQTVGRGYGAIPATPAPPPVEGGQLPPVADFEKQAPELRALFLTGRLVTALMGALTIPVVFALGKRLFGERVGIGAALLYAITPLAVLNAHFLTVDVPCTLFVALALLWSAKLLEEASWRNYALAALWTGLATATKYNTGLVLIAPLTAHALNRTKESCPRHRAAQVVVLLALTTIVFLIACPGPILNLDAFWNGSYPGSGVRYELFEHARTGHGYLFVNTGPGWWFHLRSSLWYGLGAPYLAVAIVGVVIAIRRRTRQDLVLLTFLGLYYLVSGFSSVRFARYMIPLYPVFAVLTARLLLENRATGRAALRFAVTSVTAVLTLGYAADLSWTMTLPDPRDEAADYLFREAKPGASVAFGTIPWFYSPPLSPLFGALAAPVRARAEEQVTRFKLRIPAFEWDTSVLTPPPDYVVLSNRETIDDVDRLHLPPAVKFVNSIPSDYGRRTFEHPVPLLTARWGQLPEDLLYIDPRVSLYKRPDR